MRKQRNTLGAYSFCRTLYSTFCMLKISYTSCCPGLSSLKNSKTSYFKGLRSSMLMTIMLSGKSVLTCNRFFTLDEQIAVKWRVFRGYLSSAPSFESNSLTHRHEILSQKTKVLVAAHSREFVITACCLHLFDRTPGCDRETRTDTRTTQRQLRRA